MLWNQVYLTQDTLYMLNKINYKLSVLYKIIYKHDFPLQFVHLDSHRSLIWG